MSHEYERLIAEQDRVLKHLRGLWLEARTSEDQRNWKNRIDHNLDERCRLMRARDAAKQIEIPCPNSP